MFGIFEVYTYERLYNQSTYLLDMYIYIYQPQLVSENRKSEASTGAGIFFGKRWNSADVGWFFSGFSYRRFGRSVKSAWSFDFFPHVDPVASEAIRNFHVRWSMWWNGFFFFIGEGNKTICQGKLLIYIYICGVRWFGNSNFYIVMYCNRFFELGSNKNVLKSERTTEMTRLKFLFSFTVSSWIQCCF